MGHLLQGTRHVLASMTACLSLALATTVVAGPGIPGGSDAFRTTEGNTETGEFNPNAPHFGQPIPADFFYGGSDPFGDNIQLEGVRLVRDVFCSLTACAARDN